jgi:hypothetical protein
MSANPSPAAPLGYPDVIVSAVGTTVTKNFYGMVTGDFNRSFTPGAAKTASVTLHQGQTIGVVPGTDVLLPVISAQDLDLGAISLMMDYPDDKVDILGVYLHNDPNAPIPYNLVNGELRIGWFDVNGTSVQAGQPLLTLKVRPKTTITTGEIISFTLTSDPLNELGDMSMQVIDNAHLSVDVLEAGYTGIPVDPSTALGISCYPNPFSDGISFTYHLPANGMVSLDIYDVTGRKVASPEIGFEIAGSHTRSLDLGALAPGIYMARLSHESTAGVLTSTVRIVNEK